MAKRKSTGKRLRFEVFKRDHFTCQYCGAQPPHVVLVCDHITAVSNGGTDDLLNLVTACEACNQGKTNKELGDRAIRPDADLMYLEAQQEIAEIQRYQVAFDERQRLTNQLIGSFQELWSNITEFDWVPNDTVIRRLMTMYSLDVVEESLADVAYKMRSGFVREQGGRWVGYLHAVAKSRANEEVESE